MILSEINRDNRLKVISDSEYTTPINNLFPNIYQDEYDKWPLEYKETSKFSMLVAGKTGSTITNILLQDNNLSLIDLSKQDEVNNCFRTNYNFTLGCEDNQEIISELNEFKKILNGNSEKQLVIVTRSPIYKWCSGLVQELDEELKTSTTSSSFISEKYNIDVDSIGDIVDCSDIDDSTKKDLFSDLAYKFLKTSVIRRGTSQINHMQLYNEIIYLLLKNNNINLSKLKIIDIDSPSGDIVEFFKKNYTICENDSTQGYWTVKHFYNLVIGDLREYLLKKDKMLYNLIESEIKKDLHYYNLLLTKYKNNF